MVFFSECEQYVILTYNGYPFHSVFGVARKSDVMFGQLHFVPPYCCLKSLLMAVVKNNWVQRRLENRVNFVCILVMIFCCVLETLFIFYFLRDN